jgi:hypothetical protein
MPPTLAEAHPEGKFFDCSLCHTPAQWTRQTVYLGLLFLGDEPCCGLCATCGRTMDALAQKVLGREGYDACLKQHGAVNFDARSGWRGEGSEEVMVCLVSEAYAAQDRT